MKKLFTFARVFAAMAIIGIFSQIALSRTSYVQDSKVTTLNVSGDSSFAGSIRWVPDAITYALLSKTDTIFPYGKAFVVIGGTGTITMSSTPTISTMTAYNGQHFLIMGTSNTVTLTDEGTLTGSLLELGASTRGVSTGIWLELIFYDGKWYEKFNVAYSYDQVLNTDSNVTHANLSATGTLGVTGVTTLSGNFITGAANYKSTNTAATGAWQMPATLAVIGNLNTDGTLDVDGNSYYGAANYRSTNTAASGAWAFPATVAIGGALTQTGAINAASTLDVNGNSTLGADNYVTTNTASSGAWAFPATVSIGGALTQTGDIKAGAANYVSTFTAATGVYAITGAVTSLGAITGASVVANSGAVGLYSRTIAQLNAITETAAGKLYFCSDCIWPDGAAGRVAISSGTGTGAFVLVSSQTLHIQ